MGHLIVAQEVLSALGLGKVLFVPTHIPPHKHSDVPSKERYEMTSIAISGNPGFEVSNVELKRGGKSYTVDTLRKLRNDLPGTEFYLIMGADEFVEIETWKEWELVLDLSKVVVMMRPGYGLGEVERKFMGRFMRVQVPLINISSRNIRMRVKEGKSIRYLVLREVEEYIKQKGLYR